MRSEHARHSLEALMATLKSLVPFILLVAVAAAGGALFPPGEWHAALAKPAFNPPNALFAPVWTALYVMMAVAAWRVFRREGWQAPLWLWLAQLERAVAPHTSIASWVSQLPTGKSTSSLRRDRRFYDAFIAMLVQVLQCLYQVAYLCSD
jgi:hypothetical protein